eukprot:4932028-Prymnesium_polylepis.1
MPVSCVRLLTMLASPGTTASSRVFTCVTARRDAQITCFQRSPDSTVPAFVYGMIMPILADRVRTRPDGPQSMQSVPRLHELYSAPGPPSSQSPSEA